MPFASPYLPLWTGLGVVAAWLSMAVTVSSWARRQIGYAAWRRFHYLAFGAWGLGLIHGLNAGSDSTALLVRMLYLGSVAAVGGLLAYRIVGARAAAPVRGRPRLARKVVGSPSSPTGAH